MKRRHFKSLQPVCPLCLARNRSEHALTIGVEARSTEEDVLQGSLHCTNTQCQCEYPIIDGIPIIVPDIRSYIASNIFHLQARSDLTEVVQDMLGDGCGPGSAYDLTRQHLSTYTWNHWGEFASNDSTREGFADFTRASGPGSIVSVLDEALKISPNKVDGPVLDMGCSVGRTTFELAQRVLAPGELVLGIDLNFSMLQIASRIMTHGTASFPRRRNGLVYDLCEVQAKWTSEHASNVDFWVCDATSLPFSAQSFSFLCGLNVLDCVTSPLDLLRGIERVLRHGGSAAIATPFDWSTAATPVEAWIGGHSKRSEAHGDPAEMLRTLLKPESHSASLSKLQLHAEATTTWNLVLHDRSMMQYAVQIFTAGKIAHPQGRTTEPLLRSRNISCDTLTAADIAPLRVPARASMTKSD